MTMTHVFAGNPLDRGDAERRDPDWLAAAARHENTQFLPLWQLNALVSAGEDLRLKWLPSQAIDALDIDVPPIFLGIDGDRAHFAIDISELHDPVHELALDDLHRFEDARAAAMQLPLPETGILAQARSQVDWHRRHRFCSNCGAMTEAHKGGHVRKCGNCGAEHFPRTDPVAIMLIVDGDRCLLGQPKGPLVRMGMYSALAGFIDQGEAIEEAVRREVMEEAGVSVGDVHYHSSQPWPYPSSLMIGCHGVARSTEIRIDESEMHDVRWVTRDKILDALAGKPTEVKVPGELAIAHHLIRSWAEGEVTL
ncbi:MAG: NAD(+) diphosphatase [Pseudomonadota bacterium]